MAKQPVQTDPPQTNGKAVTSLVLGILAIIIPVIGLILGIIALILGHQSKKAIDENGGTGRGMAVAGFVCGIIGTCIWALYLLFAIIGVMAFMSMDTNAAMMLL